MKDLNWLISWRLELEEIKLKSLLQNIRKKIIVKYFKFRKPIEILRLIMFIIFWNAFENDDWKSYY